MTSRGDPLAADTGPVFAPVELEGLARREGQRHEHAPSGSAGLLLLGLTPGPGKAATRL